VRSAVLHSPAVSGLKLGGASKRNSRAGGLRSSGLAAVDGFTGVIASVACDEAGKDSGSHRNTRLATTVFARDGYQAAGSFKARLPIFSVSAMEPVNVTVYELRRVWKAACRLSPSDEARAALSKGRKLPGVPPSLLKCDCLEEVLLPHPVAKSSITLTLPPSMSVQPLPVSQSGTRGRLSVPVVAAARSLARRVAGSRASLDERENWMSEEELRSLRWSGTGGGAIVEPALQDAVFRRLGGVVRWGLSEECELVEHSVTKALEGQQTLVNEQNVMMASGQVMQRMRPCAAPTSGTRFARP